MSDVDSERIDEMVTDVSVWIGRTAVGAMEDLYERDALLELQRLGKLAKDLLVKLAAVSDTSEQWQVRCAGCLCAAEGATGEQFAAKQGDYGWTPAYQKTLELRREFDQLRAELASIQDAGDEEIDSLRHKVNYLYLPESEEDSAALDALESVAKARGQKIAEQAAELEKLRMAIGCASTIKGSMVMRPDDPLGMMQEVCSYVQDLLCEREISFAAKEACRTLRSVIEGTKKHTAELIRERDEAIGLLKCLAVLCGVGLIEYHANHGDPQAKRILELTAK